MQRDRNDKRFKIAASLTYNIRKGNDYPSHQLRLHLEVRLR
jgi:hypothetical protein